MPTINEAKNAVVVTTCNECHCQKKCGHVWVSVADNLPLCCPRCHSPTWWVRPKIRLKKGN